MKRIKEVVFIVLAILVVLILIKFSLESDFAKLNDVDIEGSDAGNQMKAQYYKELHHSSKFKKSAKNDNILSLGYFTVNIDSVKNNKLMTKVTVEMQEDVIDMVMSNQAVIRDDVINSISNLESSDVNPTNISRYIKNSLNTRMQKDVVKGVYLEEFVIQ